MVQFLDILSLSSNWNCAQRAILEVQNLKFHTVRILRFSAIQLKGETGRFAHLLQREIFFALRPFYARQFWLQWLSNMQKCVAPAYRAQAQYVVSILPASIPASHRLNPR